MFLQAAVRTTCTAHNLGEAGTAGNADSQMINTRATKGQPPGAANNPHWKQDIQRILIELTAVGLPEPTVDLEAMESGFSQAIAYIKFKKI